MDNQNHTECAPTTDAVAWPSTNYGADVYVRQYLDKVIVVVATAHISQESANLVEELITSEKPDGICLELDQQRYMVLTSKHKWQNLDVRSIIKSRQLATLLVSLLMASSQRRLGDGLGVTPGAELLAAVNCSKMLAIPLHLCDRDVRITLKRAWRKTTFWKKLWLSASFLTSFFDKSKISEEELRHLKQQDVLARLVTELGGELPELKQVLIDERDLYLAEKIKQSPGQRLVAVVGAAHVCGILHHLDHDARQDLDEISRVPAASFASTLALWMVPILILGAILLLGLHKGMDLAGKSLLYWVLANGIPTSIGALLALGHPLTILSAFFASPLTSLSPFIGAGYVCALVQLLTTPPKVVEIEAITGDFFVIRRWWSNRLLRILLVFLLTGLGSAIGTWLGGYRIFSTLVA
jgi:pheromone shutdown-related protein TraB